MTDNPRIEELRRRVQKDPASIAFAQLAEEYRRAGHYREAVDACRAGLHTHPGYLSARVTLGRALIELGELDEAQTALETVLKGAPENLAAIRGVAEIRHRRGELTEALGQYRTALSLAPNDPDLEQTVHELARQVEFKPEPEPPAASLDEMAHGTRLEEQLPDLDLFLMADAHAVPDVIPGNPPSAERDRALRTVAALEGWLDALHAAGADRRS